jgi:hypothetical protein
MKKGPSLQITLMKADKEDKRGIHNILEPLLGLFRIKKRIIPKS